MSTAIVWFRRDLRLSDHPALSAALDRHDQVLPVFIYDPEAEAPWAPGGASRWWMHHSLIALRESIGKLGGQLILRRGSSLEQLRSLVAKTKADAVYWNRLYEPAFVDRDRQVKEALREDGVSAESFSASLLIEPWKIQNGSGEPYRVFTAFWKNAGQQIRNQLASGRAPLLAPTGLKIVKDLPDSISLDEMKLLPVIEWDAGFHDAWRPGELGSASRLDAFLDDAVIDYRGHRDLPHIDATSRMSAALHFGEVSPLQIMARVEWRLAGAVGEAYRTNAEWFVREVGWRDFAHHLIFHFPRTPESPLYDEKFGSFPWRPMREYAPDLSAWQRAQTGIPIIDAGMRQLWETGWMHNRVRMIVASFLTKNLLIPWQEGARWFWDTLVDADLANNTLGWQWSAGCGADAAPYFRIFNPVLQSRRFDPEGKYLRRWLPELSKMPDKLIHAPWEAKPALLRQVGAVPGKDYPKPIVDLVGSRERALAAYQRIRSAPKQ